MTLIPQIARTGRQHALFAALLLGSVVAASILATVPFALLAIVTVAASAAAPRFAIVIIIPITASVSLLPGSTTATLAVSAAVQLGVLARCRRNLQAGPTVAVLALAILLIVSFLGSPGSFTVDIDAARNTLLSTLICLTLALSAMASKIDRIVLLRTLAATGAAGCLYLLSSGSLLGGRLATANLNSNSTGHIAALALLAAWGAFLALKRPWWLACAAPPTVLLVLSQSRGALVIAAAGAALPWLFYRWTFGRLLLGASISTALYIAWPAISTGLAHFFSSRVYTESETRANILGLTVQAVAEQPLTGLGWRTFTDYSYHHMGVVLNTHNEYTRVAAESGLIALIVLLALATMGLRRPTACRTDQALKGVLMGGLTALAFANTLSSLAICAPIWLALGTILQMRRDQRPDPARSARPAKQPVVASAPGHGSARRLMGITSEDCSHMPAEPTMGPRWRVVHLSGASDRRGVGERDVVRLPHGALSPGPGDAGS